MRVSVQSAGKFFLLTLFAHSKSALLLPMIAKGSKLHETGDKNMEKAEIEEHNT